MADMRYLLLCLLLSGCGILECNPEREVYEIAWEPYGPGTTDLDQVVLDGRRDEGWACELEGPLLAGGVPVGEVWACTGC